MKQIALSLFIFICSFKSISAKAQPIDDAADYMTAISNAHDEMDKKYMAYMSTAAHSGRARKIEKMRTQVLEAITNTKYKTIEIPLYKGDNTLRKSSMDYIELCYKVFNEDYGKIVNMEEIAEQSYSEMEAYILLQEKTNEKVHEASENLHKASEAFAAKYKVNLVEGEKDELSEKMSIASKLNHYRNQVYLIFFKCNWQDGEITKAINANKVNEIEQGRGSLIRYANEGLATLENLRSFDGDLSLYAACKESIQYYKSNAVNEIPKITDYFLKKENFDKLKKSFDSKSDSKRTKEDVDAFNKSVKEMNEGVGLYNETNNRINKSRSAMLDNWNRASKDFGDTHMPKYKA